MVRANYNNLAKGVHETTKYLELFLRNLLLGEDNPLKNRAMHISGKLDIAESEAQKQDVGAQKQDIDLEKRDIEAMIAAGLTRKSAANTMKLYSAFGPERFFGRNDAMEVLGLSHAPASTLLKKLAEAGITASIPGMGKGKYRFDPGFFKRGE